MSAVTQDHIAISGYSILFVFTLMQLVDTYKRPVDLIANLLLLTGLGSLISYHFIRITTGHDETNDSKQLVTRQLAHTALVGFFLLTLLPQSRSKFQNYDYAGLAAHMFLLYAVTAGKSQVPGAALLFIYFIFASYRSCTKSGPEVIQLVGRLLMVSYFGDSLIGAVKP